MGTVFEYYRVMASNWYLSMLIISDLNHVLALKVRAANNLFEAKSSTATFPTVGSVQIF